MKLLGVLAWRLETARTGTTGALGASAMSGRNAPDPGCRKAAPCAPPACPYKSCGRPSRHGPGRVCAVRGARWPTAAKPLVRAGLARAAPTNQDYATRTGGGGNRHASPHGFGPTAQHRTARQQGGVVSGGTGTPAAGRAADRPHVRQGEPQRHICARGESVLLALPESMPLFLASRTRRLMSARSAATSSRLSLKDG